MKALDTVPMQLLLLPLVAATAAGQTTRPASGPASRPATRPGPQVMAILERLENKGDDIKDIRCRVRYEMVDNAAMSKVEQFGVLEFLRTGKSDGRIRVEFDKTRVDGGRSRNEKEIWVYDGEFLSKAKERQRTMIRYRTRKPGEPPADLLAVATRYFPVPFGQKVDEILKSYDVTLAPPAKDDPRDVLRLVPRPDSEQAREYQLVEFHVSREIGLPTRITTYSKQTVEDLAATVDTADFSDIEINKGVDKSRFNYVPPPDWEISEQTLE